MITKRPFTSIYDVTFLRDQHAKMIHKCPRACSKAPHSSATKRALSHACKSSVVLPLSRASSQAISSSNEIL